MTGDDVRSPDEMGRAMAMHEETGPADPAPPDPDRPSFLELFFDLAFVFALITLSEKLRTDLTWTGAGQTLVLLLAFTLIWSQTVWAGDAVDLNQPVMTAQIIAVMAGSLLLAGTVAEAYGDRGPLFAITYLTIQLGRSIHSLLAVPDPAGRPKLRRFLTWSCGTGVLWILGGLVPVTPRVVLWAVAITMEYVGVVLGWPVPWSWRRLARPPRLAGERVAERYRQFVIIALGVSLFLMGQMYVQQEYRFARAAALTVVFVITVLIWRLYIHLAGDLMTGTIADSRDPTRLSQLTAFVHLVIVAGIVGTSTAGQLVIGRPLGATPPSWAMVVLGGPALFLLGRLLLGFTVFAQVSRVQLAGLAGLVGLAPATTMLPPIMVGVLVAVVLTFVALAGVVEARTRRPTLARR